MDGKERLSQDIMELLTNTFDIEQISVINMALTKAMQNYDIQIRSTQLTVYDDKNERLLKRYSACLYVDGKSKKTIDVYVRVLKLFSEFLGIPFDEIGTYDIRYYLASMKEKGLSDRTLENYRSYISAFYQWLTKEDFIAKNPCDKINPIKYKEEIRKPFTETEIDKIRSHCTTIRNRALVEMLLSSGIRVAELSNLQISDIDFNSLSVHIREGKGAKERVSYMTSVCAMHLKAYLLQRFDNNPALFVSDRKNQQLNPSGIRFILKSIEKASNIEDIHPHRFRRTFATNLAKRGMDVQTIARLMGHSNIQTTMIYVAMDDNKIISEYKKHTA